MNIQTNKDCIMEMPLNCNIFQSRISECVLLIFLCLSVKARKYEKNTFRFIYVQVIGVSLFLTNIICFEYVF